MTRRGSRIIRAVLVLPALVLPVPGLAAETVDLFSLSLEELSQIRITSSTMTDESLRTVPSSMSVYTREDIRRLGLRHVAELVNYVPGYQSYRTDYNTLAWNTSSRGRSVGASGSEILVLIDGQRLNNDWSGGASQVDSLVPLENVERVEFIRGPGSAIYGSNAMNGVINIVTRSERELVAEGGSDGQRHASAQWHVEGTAGKLDLYTRQTQRDGETASIFQPTTSTYIKTRDPYRADDVYLRGELGEFSLAARAAARDTQEFYAVGFADQASTYYDSRSDSLNFGWKHNIADDVNIEGHVFNSHKNFQLRSSLNPALNGMVLEGGIEEEERGTQWVLQGGEENLRWLLGWEWRNPQLMDTSAHVGTLDDPYATIPVLPQAPEVGRTINSKFVQLQLALTDTLALTTGLRHDDYSDFGEHSSPRIAVVKQLGDKDTLKGLYSEAFRAPTPSESRVINSGAILQNPYLQPETAKTSELVWMHMLDEGMVSTTVFDTQVQDAIVQVAVSNTKRQPVNSEMTIAGLEMEWQASWGRHWQSRIAATHLFDTVGDLHTQSSTLLGGSLSYENPSWTLSLLANYQASMLDPNEQNNNASSVESTRFGGHAVVGAHAAWRAFPELEIYVHADNVLDREYAVPAFQPTNDEGVPAGGRVLTAGLRWHVD